MDLCNQLRSATREPHDRIEALAFSQQLANGELSRDDYLALLQHLLTAHRELENELASRPECAGVYLPEMNRAEVIAADLRALGAEVEAADHPAIRQWLAWLREQSAVRPEVWFGALYVFEGSRLGSMMLVKPLAKSLGVIPAPGNGLDYHMCGMAGRMPAWQRFKAALDATVTSPEGEQAVMRAAAATFTMFHDVYASLCHEPVASVNTGH